MSIKNRIADIQSENIFVFLKGQRGPDGLPGERGLPGEGIQGEKVVLWKFGVFLHCGPDLQ